MQNDDVQNYEGLNEDINNLSDNDQEPHLTKQDYERSLDQEPLFGNEEIINNMGGSDYQGIIDSIMFELQQKYTLRPRDKNSITAPLKKILLITKTNEAVQTSTETQAAKTNTTETKATQIQEFDLEVKPTKLVKDQGLARLLAESNLRALEIKPTKLVEGQALDKLLAE
jgi:hypothetical protein